MKMNIVVKGWYLKPDFDNRFEIEWPHKVLPRIGEYIDIREFKDEPKLDRVYRVDMVEYGYREIYVCLTPIK